MIPGIFEAIQYSASRAVTQEDYNYLQDTFVEFVKLDPRIYDSNVWLAKALFDDDPEQALILLKKAIEITPSREEAYRELIHLSSQLKDSKEFTRENYCDNYFSAQIGGYSDLHFSGMLGSNNLKKFGVKFILWASTLGKVLSTMGIISKPLTTGSTPSPCSRSSVPKVNL